MTETRFTAWASTRGNDFGADPGISITESAIEDGNVREQAKSPATTPTPGPSRRTAKTTWTSTLPTQAILEGRLGHPAHQHLGELGQPVRRRGREDH